MADVLVAVAILVVLGLLAVVAVDVRRTRSAPVLPTRPTSRASWHAANRGESGTTVVVVELYEPGPDAPIIERREVGRVADGDPDYDRRLAGLMQTARERAVILDLNRE